MSSRLVVSLRRRWQASRLAQIAALILVWYLATRAVGALGIPLSGGVLGLGLVLLLLASGAVALATVERGADWLLTAMSLFFVPAALGVLDHPELRGLALVEVLVVLVVSTAAVMLVTGLVVEVAVRRRRS